MNPPHSDPFYVGYAPKAPPAVARFLRIRVGIVLGVGLALALAAALWHPAPAPASFEYGVVREFTGVLRLHPYPLLTVSTEGAPVGHLLVGETKHGADSLVQGLDGHRVQLAGRLVYRGEYRMIEVHGRPTDLGVDPPLAGTEPTQSRDQMGEVVDSKCHLGAMNPGDGPTHRLCAIRCLRGGVPPLLAWSGADGRDQVALLTNQDGTRWTPTAALPIGEPVRVIGQGESAGGWLVIRATSGRVR